MAVGAESISQFKQILFKEGLSPRSLDLMLAKMQEQHYTKKYVVIVDYTLPSNIPRFFLIDWANQMFWKYYVSHAVDSGGLYAESFTNTPWSLRSSLGFMRTKLHRGKFGKSLKLFGVSASTTRVTAQAATGPILIHGAEYASREFLQKYGRLGRSYGCVTVSYEDIPEIYAALGADALVLAYNDRFWDQSQAEPNRDLGTGQSPPAEKWEIQENENGLNLGGAGYYRRTYLK